jgi:hypothetical protein
MKLQGKNVTGSMLFAGLLALGLLNIAGSGITTVNAVAAVTTTGAAQQTFSTPEQAGQALRAAVGAGDENTLAQILGPDSKAILFSGDPAEDKAALAEFVTKYDRMNRWVAMTDGSRFLYIGADNYVYPLPLAQNSSGQWYFNTAAGKDEILARRIGKNELLAINAVSAMANAEELYFKSGSYTDKILSTPGKQDGLYWEVPADQPSSPLGRLNVFANDVVTSTPPGAPPIFDGYSFRIITGQGKSFTIVATPVTYEDSGIMTFVLSKDGQVYQKDLGPNSAAISSYNPNDGWTPAE